MTVFDPERSNSASVRSAAASRGATTSGQDDSGREDLPPVAEQATASRAEHARMLAWEDQLRSIQQLGQRLATLTTVSEIGYAICNELRELVRSHNVRVYRVHGEDAVAVAWRGDIGEYADEVGEELNVRVGEGITGWVARHGVPQYLPNAAHDPRAMTLPGTDPDLDESMLLAPMRFDDRTIGVIVLSRLGIDQFQPDELRYLEIYASMAAQAMANADTTQLLRAQSELLARQLAAQRQLLRATESILSTLDPHGVVEEIAQCVGSLVPVDTLLLVTRDRDADTLRILFSKGQETPIMTPEGQADVAAIGAVARSARERAATPARLPAPEDLRLVHTWQDDALVVAPLVSQGEVMGALAVLRRGGRSRFDDMELELIQLFAGHVSIAFRNAVQHQAVELRAQTDALTGLKNHGTFQERLDRWVCNGRRSRCSSWTWMGSSPTTTSTGTRPATSCSRRSGPPSCACVGRATRSSATAARRVRVDPAGHRDARRPGGGGTDRTRGPGAPQRHGRGGDGLVLGRHRELARRRDRSGPPRARGGPRLLRGQGGRP